MFKSWKYKRLQRKANRLLRKGKIDEFNAIIDKVRQLKAGELNG